VNSPLLPAIPAPLDRQFQPAVLVNRNDAAAARKSGRALPLDALRIWASARKGT